MYFSQVKAKKVKQYLVRRYTDSDFSIWNNFIEDSKNGNFLFHRNYMGYHKDRFQDFSLLVFENQKIIAIVPANIVDNTVYSHQGLTYGGLILKSKIKLETVLEIFKEILFFLDTKNVKTIHLKIIPEIYCKVFSQEIEYALFLTNSRLYRCDCLSFFENGNSNGFSKGRIEGIKKGNENGLVVTETQSMTEFWNEILEPNLQKKHQSKPVHSLLEIEKLKILFPKNIRQFNVYFQNKIVAGTTIFESENVAHTQYIASNEDKNSLGSLDFLFDFLIKNTFSTKKYFDFGTSHENSGKNINHGLHFWKQSFGTQTTIQNYYEVETSNFKLLENIFV